MRRAMGARSIPPPPQLACMVADMVGRALPEPWLCKASSDPVASKSGGGGDSGSALSGPDPDRWDCRAG